MSSASTNGDARATDAQLEKHAETQIEAAQHPKNVRPASLAGSEQDPDIDPVLHWRTWVVVIATCTTYLSQVSVVGATGFWRANVSATVGGTAINLWLSQAFQIVNAVVGPPLARFTDQCGRKWAVIVCCCFGVLGMAIFAGANSIGMAIAGSALFGVYWAILGTTAAIASEVLPRRYRGHAQLLFQAFGTVGVPLGTIAGAGFIADNPGGYEGWRSLFWFITALLAVGGALFLVAYNPPPVPNPDNIPYRVRAFNFDKVGTILWACGLVPLLMALIWGGGQYTWQSAPVISTLTIGLAFLVIFGLHQTFVKKDGLFHHALFQNRNFVVCLIGLFVEGMVYISFTSYFGEESAVLYDSRPLQFALRFNIFTLGQLVAYPIFAYIVYTTREAKWCMAFGFLCFLGSCIGLACCGSNSSNATIGLAALAGFGFAAPIALIQTVIQLAVGPEFIGVSTALALTMRSVGGAVGTAIANAVFAAKLNVALPADIAAAVLPLGLPESSLVAFITDLAADNIPALEKVPGVTGPIIAAGAAALKEAFAYSFKFVWIVQIPFVVLALVAVLLMRPIKKQMTSVVDRPVEAIHHRHQDVAPREA